jgi:spore germination protein KC
MLLFWSLLAGCWDYREIGDELIVTGMGIAPGEEGKYKIFLEGATTSEFVQNKRMNVSKSSVFEADANTLASVLYKGNQGLPRHLDFTHLQLVAIDEALLRDGDLAVFDFLERSRDIRNILDVVAVKSGMVKDVLTTVYTDLTIPSFRLRDQINEFEKQWGGDRPMHMQEFIRLSSEVGQEPVLPMVQVINQTEESQSAEFSKKPELASYIWIAGTAFFKDGKMTGMLRDEQSRDFFVTQRSFLSTSYEVACGKDKYFNIYLNQRRKRIQVRYTSGNPRFDVHLSFSGRLDGIQCEDLNLSDPASYERVERLAEREVRKHVLGTIRKMQNEYGSDIYGFGNILRQSDYTRFKQVKDRWNEEFARADVTVSVDIELARSGVRGDSFLDAAKRKKE